MVISCTLLLFFLQSLPNRKKLWLEGVNLSFLVWIDHKSLKYLRTARRLNARQARWSLFLSCFNYSCSYGPGSRNAKSDALSRQFSSAQDPVPLETILPSECLIGAALMRIEALVQEAPDREPGQAINHLFIHFSVWPQVLRLGHSSRIACHPGASGRVTKASSCLSSPLVTHSH